MGGDHSTIHHKHTLVQITIIHASMVLSGCVESVNGDRSNLFKDMFLLSKIQVFEICGGLCRSLSIIVHVQSFNARGAPRFIILLST